MLVLSSIFLRFDLIECEPIWWYLAGSKWLQQKQIFSCCQKFKQPKLKMPNFSIFVKAVKKLLHLGRVQPNLDQLKIVLDL